MKLRDEDAASFVAQFNAYRKEAKQKTQALEGELLRVFSHAKALEAVVKRVEAGEYAVRQRGASSRVVVPCIPLQDRPVRRNAITVFKFTKGIMDKSYTRGQINESFIL